jgi:hypothetical protein
MPAEQTILFTVTPRGISLNSTTTPVSIFVSPRLDGAGHLRDFPDWLKWTRHLHGDGLKLELKCGANTQAFVINRTGLRPELWEQLFKAKTYVRPHKSLEDYSTRGLISFSVRENLSALKSIYKRATVELALPDVPGVDRQPATHEQRTMDVRKVNIPDDREVNQHRFGDTSRDKILSNREVLARLVNGLQMHWDGRNARRMRNFVSGQYSSIAKLAQASGPLDPEGLLVGMPEKKDLTSAAIPFSVFHHMPTPEYGENGLEMPDTAKLIDFHQALSSLNSYPELLRALGLVLDLDLPNEFIAATPSGTPGTISVQRAIPGWDWAIQPQTHPLPTAYMKIAVGQDELFFAAPRSVVEPQQPGAVLGLLNLDPAHFGLAQVDVDGGMHKAIMLAETLHPSGEHNRVPDATPQAAQHPETFDPEATLPSLRSGGFSLFADNRALQLLQSIKDAKSFNGALSSSQSPSRPFYAEDLVRGYRLDVWDSRTGAWHSLHLRNGKYVVGKIAFEPNNGPEEGFIELATAQPAPGAKDHDKELYLHEAIARWAGWSLSVPRPGKHLSRYANAKDAIPRPGAGDKFAENQPETPFRIAADYTLVRGSLASLRYGVRYRVRARAVDLAGNSLRFDDKLADAIAGMFALPRNPEGFTYLRYEPVPAPLVVIRDEAAVTAPGSAVDRLVIRTYNDDPSKDAKPADLSNADRHIIPPRAALEMGERLGTFDDASGKMKSDAASWKLMTDRDLGELRKKKIVIKGRPKPVPADGSNEYPVEPSDSIDPLPFFPDPLSRGAALRDLPGTPSGAIGRAVPDVGVSAGVEYALLSDPNPRPGSATLISFGDGADWEKTRGFRFVLADPQPSQADLSPNWDPNGRVLTVYLLKGQTKVVPLTSYVNPDDLKLMGVWQWLREYVEEITVNNPQPQYLRPGSSVDRIAHVVQRTVEGGHWMLTPPNLLTLVHAVQQPIGRPLFTSLGITHSVLFFGQGQDRLETAPGRGPADPTELAPVTAWRQLGSTDALLFGALKIHGASTARVDLRAEWSDLLDDPEKPASEIKLATVHHAALVDELPLPKPVEGYLFPTQPEKPGTDQFRAVGYYDVEHDQIAFVRANDRPATGQSGFIQAAPRHFLGDTKRHIVTYTAVATSRYREYFEPSLDFTRVSEPIVVDVPASSRPLAPDVVYVVPTFGWERQTDTNLKRSVRFGGGLRVYLNRPWFSSGEGELLGVALWSDRNGSLDQKARVKFKPFFTQWGMDPIWQTGSLTGAPAVKDFPDADASDVHLSLEEPSARQSDGVTPGRMSVAGFVPKYDEDRKLWFADLTINVPSETYMPFVRLALVRYQPHALADAKVSRVVLADFAQLTPDRSAMVIADPHHPRTVRVVVSGVAPRGPTAIIQAEPLPKNSSLRPTRFRLRVQQYDKVIGGELAWKDVASDVAKITPEKDGAVAGNVDLAIWAGTVQFANKPAAGEFRLLIEEYEFVSANYVESEQSRPEQPCRLVYAEIFEFDDALVDDPSPL